MSKQVVPDLSMTAQTPPSEIRSGMIYLLFTDIERSTRLWADHTTGMAAALADHNRTLRQVVVANGGRELGNAGDGIHAAFDRPETAIVAAVEIQRWLGSALWSEVGRLRVRMGLHCGEPIRLVTGELGGPVFNETARVQDAGSGGQVLVSAAMAQALDGRLPSGCSLMSLGVRRLRDLTPARLFQLCHPDLALEFPPLRNTLSSADPLVGGLSSFLGRERELTQLNDLVDLPIITITGPGGVGKTRLAQIFVDAHADRFRNGIAVVDLASVSRESEVSAAVATSLRIELATNSDSELTSVLPRVVRWLQSKQLLILLDNCEHVPNAVAELVSEIRAATTDVFFVCTSQHALQLREEFVYELGPLPAITRDQDEAASPAVTLFVDRARDVRADYQPDEFEIKEIVQLCDALDRLPLAIELAAARLATESVGVVLARLEDVLAADPLGGKDGDRHGSLLELVRWSYALLTDEEKLLFGRLWVFRGPFSLEAATSICGRDGVLVGDRFRQVLISLVSKSVVMHDPQQMTFRLLAPMRAYARATMSQAEREAGQRRFVNWYASWTTSCERRLRGPEERETGRALEAQFANIRAAHRRAIELGEATDAARIVAALRVFAVNQFRFEVAIWAERSLDLDDTPDELRPQLHGLCGLRAWMRGEFEVASRHAELAAEIEGRTASPTSIYARLVRLAVAGYEDRFDDALTEFGIAYEQARASDDPWWQVEVLVFSSLGCAAQGNYDLAASIAESAALLTKGDVSPTSRAWSLYALAESVHRDDPSLAVDFLASAAELARVARNDWVLGLINVSLARQRSRLGQEVEAATLLIDALDRWARAGNWTEQWRTLRETARLCVQIGREADAVALLAGVAEGGSVIPLSPEEEQGLADLGVGLATRLGEDEYARVAGRGRLLSRVAPEALVEQAHQALRAVIV